MWLSETLTMITGPLEEDVFFNSLFADFTFPAETRQDDLLSTLLFFFLLSSIYSSCWSTLHTMSSEMSNKLDFTLGRRRVRHKCSKSYTTHLSCQMLMTNTTGNVFSAMTSCENWPKVKKPFNWASDQLRHINHFLTVVFELFHCREPVRILPQASNLFVDTFEHLAEFSGGVDVAIRSRLC